MIGGSAVTVAGGATLNIVNHVAIGNGTAVLNGTQGSVVITGGATAAAQGTLSLVDGTINGLTIRGNNFATPAAQSLTLAGTAGGTQSVLNFETGNSTVDTITLAGGNSNKLLLQLGGAVVNLSALSGTTLAPSATPYTLISFATGSTLTGSFTLGTPSQVGTNFYSLSTTATALQLNVTALAAGDVYWAGGTSGAWNAVSGATSANFVTTAAGGTLAGLPGSTSNVVFTANSAANLSTTLGQTYAIGSLTFTGAGTTAGTSGVTIGGANALTLNAGTGTGITVQSGSAAHTISAPVVLGANQSWQVDNAAANGLTVSGVVSGSFGLTKTGTGTLTLGAANTYTGGLTVANGTVVAGNAAAAGPAANAVTLGSATGGSASLLANSLTVANPINLGTGAAGTLTLGNNAAATAAVFSGAVGLNGNPLTVASTGTGSVSLTGGVSGSGALTLSNAGTTSTITISTTQLNNAGTVTTAGASTGLITLSAPIGSAVTTLSHGSAGGLTISGATVANYGNITFSGTGAGAVTFGAASINNAGVITNNGATTGGTTIGGVLGSAVQGLAQSSATSALTVTSANPLFGGGVAVSAGTLNATPATATNSFTTLGTGLVTLGGGTLSLKDNATGSFQVIVTGNGTVGNNLAVTATSTLNVDRNSANAGSAYVFNNLTVGAATLNVTGANAYVANVAGTTTVTGAGGFTATTAPLNLLGRFDAGANAVTVGGAGGVRLVNTAGGAGANAVTGTINVSGGVLQAFAPAADSAVAGSSSIGTAAVTLSGTAPVLRLTPSLAGGLNTAPTAGLAAKGYQGASLTSLAAVNFLGQPQAITNATGVFAYLNLPAGGGTVANVPLNTASTAFPATTSFQFNGLLNITTAGMYSFSTQTDDFGNLFIDGNAPIVSAVNTVTGSFYLTAGLHVLSYRAGNNGTNGTAGIGYQGPDQATLASIPAAVLSNATAAQLATTFANPLSLSAGTAATLDVASNTTLAGPLTLSGAGGTLAVTGSGDVNTLTATGTVTLDAAAGGGTATLAPSTAVVVLTGNVAGNATTGVNALVLGGSSSPSAAFSATGNTVAGTISDGTAGGAVAVVKSGAGTWSFSGSTPNTYTGVTTINGNGIAAGNSTFAPLVLAKPDGVTAIPGNVTLGNGVGYATLQLGANDQIADSGVITWASTTSNFGYFQMLGFNETLAGLSDSTTSGVVETMEAQVVNASSTLTLSGSGTYAFNGFMRNRASGAGAGLFNLVKNGSGKQTLSGANITYTGTSTINAGTLELNAATAFASPVVFGGGSTGTLQIASAAQGVPSLSSVDATTNAAFVQNVAGTSAVLTVTQTGNTSFGGLIRNNPDQTTPTTFGLAKAGAGTLTLANLNTYTGVTTFTAGALSVGTLANGGVPSGIGAASNAATNLVFAGGTLQYTGGTTTIDRAFTVNAGSTGTIDVTQAATNLTLPGATGAATTGALTKVGPGALTLGGTNTYTGNTTVSNGTLNITGSLTGVGGTGNTGSVLIAGNVAGQSGVVNVSGNVNNYTTFFLGTNATGAGVLNLTGGSFTNTTTNTNTNNVNFVGQTGYGYLNITGGTFTAKGRFAPSNGTGTTGVVYVGGASGTPTLDTSAGEWFLMAYAASGGGGQSQVTVGPNGQLLHAGASNQFGLNMDRSNGYAVLNVAGGLFTNSTQSVTFGNGGGSNITNTTGIMNLAAGTTTFGKAFLSGNTGAGSTGNNAYINLAGGTLRANAAVTGLFPATASYQTVTTNVFGPVNNQAATGDASQNFAGGFTLDTSNAGAGAFAVSITTPLLAPTGVGVTQADLNVTGGTGYVGAPFVRFSNPAGGGAPAAGYALIANGQVTGIVITAPGTYAPNEAPTLTLTGGGGTGAAVTVDPLATANTGGGLTKVGAGALTLSGANTYAGPTVISGGSIIANALANGGATSAIGASSNAAANLVLDGGVLSHNGTVAAATDRNFTLTANGGGLDASGTTAGTVAFNGAMTVTATTGTQTFTLSGTGTGTAGTGTLNTAIVNGGGTNVTAVAKSGAGTWVVAAAANTYTGPTTLNGGVLSVSTVADGGVASGIGASSAAAGNLVLSGGTLQYTGAGTTTNRNYTFGNATTAAGGGFDSAGTGPLVLNGNMMPVNAAAGTQALTLTAGTASGANALNGTVTDASATALTGVTKSGAGSWTLTGANAFSGATTINAGTLNITGTNSGASPLTLTAAGAGVVNVNSPGTVATGAITWGGATAGNLNLVGGTLLVGGNLTSTSATANALTFAGGTLKSAAAITISATLPITFTGSATIDTAGGNITSSSGLAFTGSSGSGTFTVTGGNTLSAALNSSTAGWTGNTVVTGTGTTYLNPAATVATGSLTVGAGAKYDMMNNAQSFGGLAGAGTVQNTGGAAAVKALALTGAGGGNFAGAIAPAGTTAAFTGLTVNLAPGATQTFSGTAAHTYTGPTTIAGGTLAVTAAGAAFDNTAVTVAAGASGAARTLAVVPGTAGGTVTFGSTGAGNGGATLTLAGGSLANPVAAAFTMADGAIGTVKFQQQASFAGPGLTIGGTAGTGYVRPTLSFDIGGSSLTDVDLLNVSALASVGTGGATINFTALSSATALSPGQYVFMTASGGLGGTALTLGTASLAVGSTSYSLSLADSTATQAILTVTALAGNAQAFWAGGIDGSWASQAGPGGNTNFVTSAGGGTNTLALPGGTSNVTFTANSAANNLVTTLDQDFAINSLTFSGTGTANAVAGTTIASGAGTNTLTINAGADNGNVAGNGITVLAGSGPNVISAAVSLGAPQTWTVAAGTSLAVTGAVGEASAGLGLTKGGGGTLTLGGNNTFAGGLTINAGTVNVNHAGALGTGPLTVNLATLDNTSGGPVTNANNNAQSWANGGGLTFTGTNALNLGTGAVTLGADAATGTFTITNSATIPANTLTVGGAITPGNGGTAGTKTLVVAGPGNTVLSGNITKGTAGGVVVTSTSPGTLTLSGAASTITSLNVNGGAGSVVDVGAGTLTFSNAGGNFIQSSTGGTINATGGGTIVLGSNGGTANYGDNGTVAGTTLTINARLTGPNGFEVYGGSTTAGTVVLTAANTFTGDVAINGGILSVASIGNAGSTTSNLGAGTNIYIAGGGTNALRYTGTGETTNRVINLNGTTTAGTIEQAGTGLLKFTANFATPGAGNKAITLSGSTAGTGEIAGVIRDNAAGITTGVTKTGTGTWTLTAANTYTGATTVVAGTLVNGNANGLGANTATLVFGDTSANTGTLDLTSFGATVSGLSARSNSANASTVVLPAGRVLTVNGGVTIGYDPGAATNTSTTKLTIGGGGSLVVTSAASNVAVGLATAAQLNTATANTLDLTGLSSVTLGNGTTAINELRVAYGQTAGGTLLLSDTANAVTANTVQVGHSVGANAGVGQLTLGAGTNVVRADTINIGMSKAFGTVSFASQAAGSAGTVTITNKAGTGGADVVIGSQTQTSTSAVFTGTLDLRGHVATVTANAVTVGLTNTTNNTGTASGVLSIDAGTFDAASLALGVRTNGTSVGTGTTANTATLNVGGGAFTVAGATAAARNDLTGSSGGVTATINLTGGTFTTGTLVGAAKTAAGTGAARVDINVSGGTFTVNGGTFTLAAQATAGTAVGNLNVTGGAFRSNADILDGGGSATTTVTVAGGTLDLMGHAIGGATAVDTLNLRSGTLQDVAQINNGAAVTKTTAGTLVLAGTNTFTGATTVSAGVLSLTGTHGNATTGAGGYTVATGSVLAGTGVLTLATGKSVSIAGRLTTGDPVTEVGTLRVGSAAAATAVAVAFTTTGTFSVSAGDSVLALAGVTSLSAPLTDATALTNPAVRANADTLDIAAAAPGTYVLATWEPANGGARAGVFDHVTMNGYEEPGGTFTSLATVLPGNAGVAYVSPSYSVYYNDTTGQITTQVTTAIPEPSAAAALAAAAVGLLAGRRRRRSRRR